MYATGAVEISEYAGMMRRAPFVAGMLVFFFLSLAGIPPTAGFIGKFFVFAAALRAGYLFLAAVGVVNSVISVVYYFNIVRAMFFMEAKDSTPIRVAPLISTALTLSAGLVLLIALYPQPLYTIADLSMAMLGVVRR